MVIIETNKTMKHNKYTKWLSGAMMTAALAAGITACSDDHFDVSSDVLGKNTIWENIKSNQNLSEYADILQNVKYSTTEEKTTPETYADLLNGDQTFTVWAPANGTFNYSYYKGLLQTGVRDSIYKVETELIRNNMSRYTNILNGKDSLKLDLFNSKSAWLNYDRGTIKSQKITTPNVGSSNGVLHVIEGPVSYQPNLYEFLATRPDLDSINTFIKRFQKTEFNQTASTQGPTINGQVTWVDSVTYISNDYTNAFINAYLNREDSNYVMLIPDNKAWTETLNKTKSYFHYKSSYSQDIHTLTEQGADTTLKSVETKFTPLELDSIVNLQSKNAICQNLVFNANWQYERVPITTLKDVANADSLKSTSGLKFKKPGTMNATNKINCVEVDFNTIFGKKDPIELSNGYAYVVDEFTYPSSVYAPTVDMTPMALHESDDNQCMPEINTIKYINGDSIITLNNFVMGARTATSHPGSFFKLPQVLSATYDIYVVLSYNNTDKLQNKFRAYISYDTEDKRIENYALRNPNEKAVDANNDTIYNGNYFVNKPLYDEEGNFCPTDTILLAKDFTFPVCYVGLNNAYPIIQIKSNFTTKEKNSYTRELWVNAIILKPKDSAVKED